MLNRLTGYMLPIDYLTLPVDTANVLMQHPNGQRRPVAKKKESVNLMVNRNGTFLLFSFSYVQDS